MIWRDRKDISYGNWIHETFYDTLRHGDRYRPDRRFGIRGGKFIKKKTATVTAAANSGYIFAGWYSGGVLLSSSLTYMFTVLGNITLEARFIPTVTVTVTAQPGGTVSGGKTVEKGQQVTITATANGGYKFDGWYDGNTKVSGSTPYTFTPAGDITLTAKFVFYSVAVSGGTMIRNADGSVTLRNSIPSGQYFDGWYSGGVKVSSNNTYTFMPTADITITARYIAYTVTVFGGTMIRNADGSVTLSASVPADYTWNGWYNGSTLVSTNNPYTFTPTTNMSLTAKMTAPEWAGLTFYQFHPVLSTGVPSWTHSGSLLDVNITIFIKIENEIVKSHTFTGRGNNGTKFSFVFSFGTVRVEFQWRDTNCNLHYLSGSTKTVYGAVKIG